PGRAVAPSGLGTGAIAVGFKSGRSGKPTVLYELMITSLGGTRSHDGASIVLPMNHFAPGTPIEIVETEYPVSVRQYKIWQDSAGAGRWRGGLGFVREYEFLADCMLTVRSANHKHPAWGLFGGGSPKASKTTIQEPESDPVDTDVLETRPAQTGSRLAMYQSGGGGYGNPKERPKALVLSDIENGYVSREAARHVYGVKNPDDS
ncbi:hydantoinase B/oxoprolinase family protein, partial [Alphaproteobacteria bacterium]|nr:hydantoinase B/oxoprolinase family protein [Alphaproteobacteria bacterium]